MHSGGRLTREGTGVLALGVIGSLLVGSATAVFADETLEQLDKFLAPPTAPAPARVVPPRSPATLSPPSISPTISSSTLKLDINSHVPGTLGRENQYSEGFYQDVYQFDGEARQLVRINLIGSDDRRMQLDPYVRLIGPSGELVAEDDNSGREPARGDAQLRLELPDTGTYTIVVTTATPEDRGRYVLGVLDDL